MKYSLVITLITFSLASCRTDLTNKEIKWIPYKKGEVLVFESSKHELDTIYISDLASSYTYNCEILEVKYQYRERSATNVENSDTVHSFLMALTAGEDNNTVFTINLNRKFALFAPFNGKHLSWLDSLQPTSSVINNIEFNDVLILKPDVNNPEYLKYANDSLFVNKLYWSKTYGLIQFDISNNNTVWKLKKRYSL